MDLTTKQKQSGQKLSEAIRSVNTGLSTVLKTGACSVALSTVLGSALFSSTAQAQGADGITEVTVTGIRASLKRAMDRKRDAKGIVDAINSEDMGKFPDTNLAESLQRISGVSIDRSRGEGSRITVRGLGPDFNLVLFNGRQLPTQSGTGRSFDFANIASEGISAVEIKKTGDATLPTGGLGATINVITTKPLDNPGLNASVGFKAVRDTSTSEGDQVSPEFSGIFSQTFLDDTVGVALTGSWQKRDHGVNTASVSGYRTFDVNSTDWGTIGAAQLAANNLTGDDIYSVPQNTGYEIAEFERERINGQLTVQWQPIDSVRATVDYTYAYHDLKRRYSNLSAWYNFGGDAVTSYTDDGVISSPNFYSEVPGAGDFAMGIGQDAAINENESVGFNVDWQVSEQLRLVFDYHDSSAEFRPNSPFGTSAVLSLASFTRTSTTTHFDAGEIPILELGLSSPLNADDIFIAGSVFSNNFSRMEIEQATISGNFEINDTMSVDFGVQLTELNNQAASTNVQRDTWGGVGNAGDIADLLEPATIAGAFDDFSGSDDSRLQTDYFTGDIEEIVRRAESLIQINGIDYISPAGAINQFGDCGTGLCASSDYNSNLASNRLATEETTAVYMQYNLELVDLALPVTVHAGIRYEETDVSSPASVPQVVGVTWVADNEFSLNFGGDPVQSSQTGSYDNVLPNLDVSVELMDDLMFRASYSETIARADYGAIQGGFVVDTIARVDGASATLGNPGILPYESTNYDVSLEWYFGDESYASIGYFQKDVVNFIGTQQLEDVVLFPGVSHVVGGAYWDAAVAAGNTANPDIRAYIFANFDGQPGVDSTAGSSGTIEAQAGDPTLLFDISQPGNTGDASVDGVEIAVQHAFGESGFGVIANTTIVNSDTSFNNAQAGDDPVQFAVPGASDTINLIGFYDKDGLQARIAYNWRASFLSGIGHGGTGQREPNYTESYAQWDFSASYEILDTGVSVFVEGINITNETNRSHSRSKQQVLFANQTGARYNFGARYKF